MFIDLSKLSEEDKRQLFRNFISTGSIVSKLTDTKLDDLLFDVLGRVQSPNVIGETVTMALKDAKNLDVAGIDPLALITLINAAMKLWEMFKKK